MTTCINLTQKMHQCKRTPAYIVVGGTVSAHCKAHFARFYGNAGADIPGTIYLRYTVTRYNLLTRWPLDNISKRNLARDWGEDDARRAGFLL